MAKWKYFNWLLVAVILVFMYLHFAVRYKAGATAYWVATIGWLIAFALGYYIFDYNLKKSKTTSRKTEMKPIEKIKERPKIKLKK